MRTRDQMQARVQRYAHDVDGGEFEPAVILGYLDDAAAQLWDDILSSTSDKILLKYSAVTDLAATVEEYTLPADCARIHSVELRISDADTLWIPVTRRPPPGAGLYSGNGVLFGVTSAGGSRDGSDRGWWNDCAVGSIRLWPALALVNQESYRLRYYSRPLFPTAAAGTFADPAASGTAIRLLPERSAEAVEHLAAALLGGEELEDGRPIGVHGSFYRNVMNSILSTADQTRPLRHYVQRTRG